MVQLTKLACDEHSNHYVYVHVHQCTEHSGEPVDPDENSDTLERKSQRACKECVYDYRTAGYGNCSEAHQTRQENSHSHLVCTQVDVQRLCHKEDSSHVTLSCSAAVHRHRYRPGKISNLTANAELRNLVLDLSRQADSTGSRRNSHDGHLGKLLRHPAQPGLGKEAGKRCIQQELNSISDKQQQQELEHRNDHLEACRACNICKQAEDTDWSDLHYDLDDCGNRSVYSVNPINYGSVTALSGVRSHRYTKEQRKYYTRNHRSLNHRLHHISRYEVEDSILQRS